MTNQVSTHQFRYKFSRPIDLSQFEIALGSVAIYYSWKAITASRGNNKFRLVWPTGSTTQTFAITLPAGTYQASDINAYLRWWSIQNNLYLINNTTGQYYYFISCALNAVSYDIQFTIQPYKEVSGDTSATGVLAFSTSGYTPQLSIIDSGTNSFTSIVGFPQGLYPPAQQARIYSVDSPLTPEIDPVASVIMGASNLNNPITNNNQVRHSFTSAGVSFGGLVVSNQLAGESYCLMQGTTNELLLSFYDQNMMPLQLTDPNLCVRLLMRQRKSDLLSI